MKLYLMKKQVLDMLKGNMTELCGKYYTEKTNKWIYDICGMNPFVEYKEVPDFELASLDSDYSKGEIDFLNCKIIYEKLKFLNESQACEEMLWAGLTHTVFYDYMKRRWGYGYGKMPSSPEKEAGEILTRFFYKGSGKSGFYRNTISKCWWIGHNTYRASKDNNFEVLDIIGFNDFNSKMNEIFYNFNFTANKNIMNGITDALLELNNEGINYNVKTHLRPAMSHLNAVGGNTIIDCMSREEIKEIVLNDFYSIIQGDEPVLTIEEDYENAVDDIDEDVIINETSNESEGINESSHSSEMSVILGCSVTVNNSNGEEKQYKYDVINGTVPIAIRGLKDHKVGDKVAIMGKEYIITAIDL